MRFANDDRPSNACASPGRSLLRNGAAGHGESVHKAQTSDNFGPLPNGDGGGRGVPVVQWLEHCVSSAKVVGSIPREHTHTDNTDV